jgi:hypothetical protein
MAGDMLSPTCMNCRAVTGKDTCFPGPCEFFQQRNTPGTKAHDVATLARIRRGKFPLVTAVPPPPTKADSDGDDGA